MQREDPDDYNELIYECCQALDRINADLASMPRAKFGSQWHTDRVAARRRLLEQRQYLCDRQQELLRALT